MTDDEYSSTMCNFWPSYFLDAKDGCKGRDTFEADWEVTIRRRLTSSLPALVTVDIIQDT